MSGNENGHSGDETFAAKLKQIAERGRVKSQRETKFVCPAPSCTLYYKSLFGLKYHLDKQHHEYVNAAQLEENTAEETDDEAPTDNKRPSQSNETKPVDDDGSETTQDPDRAKGDDADTSGESGSSSGSSDSSEGDSDDDAEDDAEEGTGENDKDEKGEKGENERNRQRRARSRAYLRKRFAILNNRRRKRRKKLLTIASERNNSKMLQLKRSSSARGSVDANGGMLHEDIFARADNLITVDDSTHTVTVAFAPGGKCFSFSIFDELSVELFQQPPAPDPVSAPQTAAEPSTSAGAGTNAIGNANPNASTNADTSANASATANANANTDADANTNSASQVEPEAKPDAADCAPHADSTAVQPDVTRTPPPKREERETDAEPSSTNSSPRRRIRPVMLSPIPPKTPKKDDQPSTAPSAPTLSYVPPPPPSGPLTAEMAAKRAAELRTASARHAALARWRRRDATKGLPTTNGSTSGVQVALPIAAGYSICLTSGFKVPECNFRIIDDEARARRRAKACTESDNTTVTNVYYRHVERTDEELDETVEYDMDDQDAAWLALLNEQRAARNPPLPPLSSALFERLLDRFEKDSHFEQLACAAANADRSDAARDAHQEEDDELEEHEAVCCICLDGECENSNAILFCDLCNLPVHQDCYGVPYIPEGQWLCRRCQLSPSRSVDCCLCPLKGGAFKLVADADSDATLASATSPTRTAASALALSPTLGAAAAFPFGLAGTTGSDVNAAGSARWAHVVCALWIPEVAFANTVFLEPIIDVHRIPASRWRLTCYLCKQRNVGACIQCSKANCYTAFHVTCAQQAGLCMKIAPIAGTACVKKTAFCDLHTPPSLAFSSMMPADVDSLPGPGTPSASAADADGESECGRSKNKVKAAPKSKLAIPDGAVSAVSSSASFASANKTGTKVDRAEASSAARAQSKSGARATGAAAHDAAGTNDAESGSQAGSMTAERLERLAQLRRRVLTERRSAQQATINIPVIAAEKLARLAQRCGLSDADAENLMRRLYAFWQLKRLARCGVALLRRLQVQTRSRPALTAPERRRRERDARGGAANATAPTPAHAAGGLAEQVKMWSRLRRDFEKLRLLVEQVRKREKLKRELLRIEQRCAQLTVQPFVLFARRLLTQLTSFDSESLFAGDSALIRARFKLAAVDARSLFACTSVNLRTITQRIDAAEYTALDQLHSDVTKMVANHRRLENSARLHTYVDRYGKQAEALLAEARKTMLANSGYDPFTGVHCEHALLQAPLRRCATSPTSPPASSQTGKHPLDAATRQLSHPAAGESSQALSLPSDNNALRLNAANSERGAQVTSPRISMSETTRPAISFSAYRNTEAIRLDSDEEDNGVHVRAGNTATKTSPLRSTPKRAHLSPSRDEHSDSDSCHECDTNTGEPTKQSPLRSGHALFEAVRLQPAASHSPLLCTGGQFTLPKATKVDRDADAAAPFGAKPAVADEEATLDTLEPQTTIADKPVGEVPENQPDTEDGPTTTPRARIDGDARDESSMDTLACESTQTDVALRIETTMPSSAASASVSGSGNLSAHTCHSRDSDDLDRITDGRDTEVDDCDTQTSAAASGRKRQRSSASTCDSQPCALQRFDFVWAKVSGHPFFPAIVIHSTHMSDELKTSREGWIMHRSVRFPAPPTDILELAAQFSTASAAEAHYLVLFFDTKQTWTWVTRSKLAPLGDSKTDQRVMASAKNKKATVKKAYDRACADLNKIRSFEQRFPAGTASSGAAD